MAKRICDNCEHYEGIDDNDGCCVRYPPVLLNASKEEYHYGWAIPTVSKNHRCGEFKMEENY